MRKPPLYLVRSCATDSPRKLGRVVSLGILIIVAVVTTALVAFGVIPAFGFAAITTTSFCYGPLFSLVSSTEMMILSLLLGLTFNGNPTALVALGNFGAGAVTVLSVVFNFVPVALLAGIGTRTWSSWRLSKMNGERPEPLS